MAKQRDPVLDSMRGIGIVLPSKNDFLRLLPAARIGMEMMAPSGIF